MTETEPVKIGSKYRNIPVHFTEVCELPEGDAEAMSVISSQRGIAKMEFFHRARIIRRDITELCRNDFGIHSRNQPSVFNRELNENDIILLKEFGGNLRNLARDLMYNITRANTIYPYIERERDHRRLLQDQAIGCCEIMYQEFSYCVDTFHVKPSIFNPMVAKLNIEVELLRAWRKQTNSMFREPKAKKGADMA